MAAPDDTSPEVKSTFRHPLIVRVAHWLNALALALLLLSGLQIFNAHPALYWGDRSDRDRPLLALTAHPSPAGPRGVTRLFGHDFDTTGFLGVSRDSRGDYRARGFPEWLTVPGPQWLAMGRRWHFFFAWLLVINGIVYLVYALTSRHLARDVIPRRADWRDFGRSLREHLLFRFHDTGSYNPLQKLSYAIVIFGLIPLMLLTGLMMSPAVDAAVPIDALVGGRQSARTLHFLIAWLLVGFTFIHVVMVLLTGPLNQLRGMVTGWYRIRRNDRPEAG